MKLRPFFLLLLSPTLLASFFKHAKAAFLQEIDANVNPLAKLSVRNPNDNRGPQPSVVNPDVASPSNPHDDTPKDGTPEAQDSLMDLLSDDLIRKIASDLDRRDCFYATCKRFHLFGQIEFVERQENFHIKSFQQLESEFPQQPDLRGDTT